MVQNWLILLPELSFLIYLIISWQVNNHRRDKTPKTFFTLSKVFILITIISTIVFYNKSVFSKVWINDNYTTLFKTVMYLIALVWFYLSSKWFLSKNRPSFLFYALAMVELLCLEMLISSQNLGLTVFLLFCICMLNWVLIRLYVDEDIISEISRLYIFFSVIFLLLSTGGCLILFQEAKSLNYTDIATYLQKTEIVSFKLRLATSLIIAFLLFMMALAPFHSCFVRMVSLTILPVSGFISLIPPLAYLASLLVLSIKIFMPLQDMLYWILGIFGGVSVFVGALSANGMSNPIELNNGQPNEFLDNLSKRAVEMFEKQCDIKNFSKLVLSDPENTSHIDMIQKMISEGKIKDPFEDEKLAELADNERFLRDLGLM